MKMDFEATKANVEGMEDDMFGHKESKGGSSHKHRDNKMMTMEDVSNELEKDFEDEISDSKKYFCMAKIAEKAGCEEDAHYLMEMSKDEFTHAYFIHTFMHEHDMEISEEQRKDFEELKDRMEKFF